MPLAGPTFRRARNSSEATSRVVVFFNSMITGDFLPRSGPTPGEAVTGEHVHGALRTPCAGLVGLRLVGQARPVLQHRIQDLPAELHLLLLREEGGVEIVAFVLLPFIKEEYYSLGATILSIEKLSR